MTMAGLGQDGLNWGRVRHLRGRLYRWADPPPTHTTARTLTTGGGLQGQSKRQSDRKQWWAVGTFANVDVTLTFVLKDSPSVVFS